MAWKEPKKPQVRRAWTDPEHQRALVLYRQGRTIVEIGVALGRSYSSVASHIQQARTDFGRHDKERLREIQRHHHAWDNREEDESLFDEVELKAEREAIATEFAKQQDYDILVLSDLHGMFRHHKVLFEALNAAHASSVKAIVVIGDVMDQYAVSRFLKTKDISLREEFLDTQRTLEQLAGTGCRLIICQGNHDLRIARRMIALLAHDEAARDVMAIIGKSLDLLATMCEGLEQTTALKGWWFRIGDAIFAHRERYMKQVGSLAEDGVKFFHNLGEEFRLLVVGHTHRFAYLPIMRDRWWLENPMASLRHDYTRESNALSSLLVSGYSIVHIGKEGRFDQNRTRPFWVSWG